MHGWNGIAINCDPVKPDEYFEATDNHLRISAAYYTEYATLETSPCYTPPLLENVKHVAAAVQRAKDATGRSQVIIVAHSMGGLVSRAYIEDKSIFRGDVISLFTFGSPHEGVPADILVYLLNTKTFGAACALQPGACNFTKSGMDTFNHNYYPNNDVKYHLVSGDAPFWSRNIKGRVAAGLIPGADDGIVPTNSGMAVETYDDIDRASTDEVHIDLFGTNTYFTRTEGTSVSYNECLEKLLVQGAMNCGAETMVSTTQPFQSPSTEAQTVHTPFVERQLSAGKVATHTVNLPDTPTLFVAQWITGQANFTLVSPQGDQITPSVLEQNPQLGSYEVTPSGATYLITDTNAGLWTMVVTVDNGQASNVDYRLFAAFEGDGYPEIESDLIWYQPGETATITVTPPISVIEALVIAQVTYANGTMENRVAESTVAGSYQISVTIPNIPGYAQVDVSLHTTNTASIPIDYGVSYQFQVVGGAFQLTDTYSEAVTLNTRFADLIITTNIEASLSGSIGLSADIVDAQGQVVAHAYTRHSASAGLISIPLVFSGEDIFERRTNGPFALTNVLLTDEREVVLVADLAEDAYTTSDYLFESFKLPTVNLPIIGR